MDVLCCAASLQNFWHRSTPHDCRLLMLTASESWIRLEKKTYGYLKPQPCSSGTRIISPMIGLDLISIVKVGSGIREQAIVSFAISLNSQRYKNASLLFQPAVSLPFILIGEDRRIRHAFDRPSRLGRCCPHALVSLDSSNHRLSFIFPSIG